MYIKVRVHSDEKKDIIVQKNADTFEVWVKAKAERGQANKAVTLLLAQSLNIEAKRLKLIKGATSPAKIFEY